MMGSEIRQDKITKQWIIYAPARGHRPRDFSRQGQDKDEHSAHDDSCPFCPGNEDQLSSIIMETKNSSEDSWQIRVVPNKFPALSPTGSKHRFNRGIYVAMEGYGHHEVIIEGPSHNKDISQMDAGEVFNIIDIYHARSMELMAEHENMLVVIFRNHGSRAGTSLAHPHSQLVVTAIVPRQIRRREEEAQRHFDQWGKCVYCEVLDYEKQARRRVVLENGSFLAFVPFAAVVPFEVWIMPKRHQADFGSISGREKQDLAAALVEILGKLRTKLNDPDYNFVINSSAQYKTDEPQLHWYLQIRPRLTTQAGFEIGSGMSINPSLPEEDADFLNDSDTIENG